MLVDLYGHQESVIEAYGAPGVYVRTFPHDRTHEFKVPIPGTVVTSVVSHDEWSDVITESYVSSDLFVSAEGRLLCNMWDPRGRRWVVLLDDAKAWRG